MEVSNVVSATAQTSTNTTSALSASTVDYDAFLKLLVTQLKNQDPTEPTDNAELMAQLASFSSVEQQIQTNSKLDQLIQSNMLGDASNLIGKQITSHDGRITGTVKTVVLADNGISAELTDGQTVPVISGTRITGADTSAVDTTD